MAAPSSSSQYGRPQQQQIGDADRPSFHLHAPLGWVSGRAAAAAAPWGRCRGLRLRLCTSALRTMALHAQVAAPLCLHARPQPQLSRRCCRSTTQTAPSSTRAATTCEQRPAAQQQPSSSGRGIALAYHPIAGASKHALLPTPPRTCPHAHLLIHAPFPARCTLRACALVAGSTSTCPTPAPGTLASCGGTP